MTPTEAALGLREWFEVFRRRGKGNEPTVKEFLEAADLIEKLDKRVPRWISVEERLPEPKEDVALHIRCGDVSFIRTGWRMGNGQFICPNDSLSGYEVTHWMSLPEMPKEDCP